MIALSIHKKKEQEAKKAARANEGARVQVPPPKGTGVYALLNMVKDR